MTNNTTGFTLVFIQNAKREATALANARRVPNFVLDESYAPIQIEDSMFLVRGLQLGALKHSDVFSFCAESEMAAFCEQMTLGAF